MLYGGGANLILAGYGVFARVSFVAKTSGKERCFEVSLCFKMFLLSFSSLRSYFRDRDRVRVGFIVRVRARTRVGASLGVHTPCSALKPSMGYQQNNIHHLQKISN